MTAIQAFFLGLIQGLTEFLPVSSSGHLVIFQNLFGFTQPPVLFDVIVHLATALAIVVFFWSSLLKLNKRLIGLLLLASLPAGLLGLVLNQQIEILFNSLTLVGFSLLITAFMLFSLNRFIAKAKRSSLRPKDALIIGLFQALAIIPGISRSGSTITAAIFRGLKPELAFQFSFLLALPAILGAQLLQLPLLAHLSSAAILSLTIGFLTAFISGYLALKLLHQLVIKAQLKGFGYYCLFLGLFILYRTLIF